MRPERHITGAGGGGKGGGGGSTYTPTESPDSLRSRQYARVIDVISEGEIGGLVNGLQSIFLDETPLQNPDGSFNFSGVNVDTRPGTQAQTYVPGFPAVENEVVVGIEVKQAAAVTRQVTNTNANAARVTLSIPQLTYQNPSNGDLTGSSVEVAIDVQSNGGGFMPIAISYVWEAATPSGTQVTATGYGIGIGFTAAFPYVESMGGYGEDGAPSTVRTYSPLSWVVEYKAPGDTVWQTLKSETAAYSPSSGWLLPLTPSPSLSETVQRTYYTPQGANGAWAIRVRLTSGGSVDVDAGHVLQLSYTDIISGKTTSRYQRAYRIELTGSPPWDIRVRRITDDSTQANLVNKVWWDTYTEIIDAKLAYPNSALVAMQVDASQFRTIPRRGYEIYGIKVQVPTNYDPATRTYTGVWGGAFKLAWSDNPAWCFYDLLTNDRYGLGDFIDLAMVDKWSLYDIARYCDELVPDGFGSMEPRFTCNLYLQTREEAYKVIANFASIFAGVTYWGGGAIIAVADKPADAVMQFTPANVIDGEFTYSGTSLKTRHTVALVAWNDPSDFYRQKIEYVPDEEGIRKYGIVETEVISFGCTSRGQAHRYGKRILLSERLLTEVESHRCGLDSVFCAPGDVIRTMDPTRSGVRFGGRVVTATTSAVTIDAPVTIEPGKTYTLYCVLPDGKIEHKSVTTAPGSVSVLAVSPAFSAAPQAESMWVLAASDLVPEEWRVMGIVEYEKGKLEITGLAYRGDKFDAIERGLVLEPLPTSRLTTAAPAAVTGLQVTESLYVVGSGLIGTRLTISWNSAPAAYFLVRYRRGNDNWTETTAVSNSIDVGPVAEGGYTISVVAVSSLGKLSPPTTIQQTIYGKTLPPADVSGFGATRTGAQLRLVWSPNLDLDIAAYRVRVGGSWDAGAALPETSSCYILTDAQFGTTRYWIKAVDTSRNESANAAYVDVSWSPPGTVPWFSISGSTLTWGAVQDVAGYRIKYAAGYDSAWAIAQPAHDGLVLSPPFVLTRVPVGAATLLIKSVDVGGQESANTAEIYLNFGDVLVENVIQTVDFKALGWPGTVTGGAISGGNLVADALGSFYPPAAAAPMYPADSSLAFYDEKFSSLEYVTDAGLLTGILPASSKITLSLAGMTSGRAVDYRLVGHQPFYALGDDEPFYQADGAAPMYPPPTDWISWPGSLEMPFNCQIQFRVTIASGRSQGTLTGFTVVIDVPDIGESFSDLVISAAGTRLPVSKSYRSITNVQATLQDTGSGAVAIRVIDKDPALGPLLKAVNAAGTFVSAQIDAQIKGY